MEMKTRADRRGFTLVELLVVVAIIGIVAAIAIPTLYNAVLAARESRIAQELNQLHMAIEAYRQKHGDYPPDFTNRSSVERHIRKAFPRISESELTVARKLFWLNPTETDVTKAEYYSTYVDPAEALVFWLGGFSTDPRRPFTGPGGPFKAVTGGWYVINTDRSGGAFDFDQTRLTIYVADLGDKKKPSGTAPSGATLVPLSSDEYDLHGWRDPDDSEDRSDNDVFPVYFPKDSQTPYVYFDSQTYAGGSPAVTPTFPTLQPTSTPQPLAAETRDPPQASAVTGDVRPYLSDLATHTYANPGTFQLVSAGLDTDYGESSGTGSFPSGSGYDEGDQDNIANFSDGKTLEDHME